MTILANMPELVQNGIAILGAFYVFVTAGAALFTMLGRWSPRCAKVAAVLGAIGVSVHLLMTKAESAAPARGFIRTRLMKQLAGFGLATWLTACALAAVIPDAAAFGTCVLTNAAAGKTAIQILPICAPSGGQTLLDVLEVILASTDPAVLKSPAFAEAMAMKKALARFDGGAR